MLCFEYLKKNKSLINPCVFLVCERMLTCIFVSLRFVLFKSVLNGYILYTFGFLFDKIIHIWWDIHDFEKQKTFCGDKTI